MQSDGGKSAGNAAEGGHKPVAYSTHAQELNQKKKEITIQLMLTYRQHGGEGAKI